MRYVCMIFFDARRLDALTQDERAALVAEAAAYDDDLQAGGHLVWAHRLERPDAAITVRIRAGRPSPTDGPFAGTSEQIGDVRVVDARDLNEAVQLASRLPAARLGGVEVRPVRALAADGG